MNPYPKKSNRSLPDGWDKRGTRKQMEQAYDKLFGESTDEKGVLKVTPKVIKRILGGR